MRQNDLIKSMDYCWIINDKKLKGSGLKRGDMVLVSGTKVVPASKKDMYLQRILVVALLVQDEKVLVPSENNGYLAYLIDPRNLEKVDEDTLKWAQENLKHQYDQLN